MIKINPVYCMEKDKSDKFIYIGLRNDEVVSIDWKEISDSSKTIIEHLEKALEFFKEK
jgi:hypothetical protein